MIGSMCLLINIAPSRLTLKMLSQALFSMFARELRLTVPVTLLAQPTM
jgi:hypothetical protein